jgi:hypothetical protein
MQLIKNSNLILINYLPNQPKDKWQMWKFSEDDKIQISKLLQSRRTIMQRISLMKLLRILYKKITKNIYSFQTKTTL